MNNRLFTNPLDGCIVVNNAIFDYVMPTLSGEGWKMLCVALRQSLGRPADEDGPWIGVAEFMQNAGIAERKPAERGLQECVYAGYLQAHPENASRAQPHYALNRNALLPSSTAAPVAQAASTKVVAPSAAVPEQAPQSPEQRKAVEALLAFSREMGATPDPASVQEVVTKNPTESVIAWIELGHDLIHMDNQTRFATVMERLAAGVPPVPLSMLVPDVAQAEEGSTTDAGASADATPPDAAASAGAASEEADALWEATLEALRPQMRSSMFKWFKPTHAVELKEDVLVVAAPNKRTKDWLKTGKLAETVQETFTSVAGPSITLEFVVET